MQDCAPSGTGTMRPRATLRKPAIITRRLLSLIVRAVAITSMSFGIAFGFLSGTTSKVAHYDPNTFAVGVAALFGAACGAIGLLLSRIKQMKWELRHLEARLDEAADRNWQIKEAEERAKSFFEAQDDVIVRRDGNGAITYVRSDPNTFAVGVAALFGAACGAIGLLLSRIKQMKWELRHLEARLDEAADRNWQIKEAEERAKSFFEAQDDVIVRRDGNGAITYV